MLLRNLLFFASWMAFHISAFSAPQPICSDARFIRLWKLQGNTKLSIIRILGLFIASSFFAAHATAAIILSQSPPGADSAFRSDSAASFVNQQAQVITLGAGTNIATVVVWGHYDSLSGPPPSDNFTISFYDDNSGSPQGSPITPLPVIASTLREATSLTTVLGQAIYKYTFNFSSSVTLAAATTYISVLNNTSAATAWLWQGIVPNGGPRWAKAAAGTSWGPRPNSLAFELSDAPILPFTVGGDVTGLGSGASVVLQNNGADDQTLSVDGSFTFTQQSDGSSYDVTVATQPDGQTCAVTSGTGTLAGADVSGISVSCADNSYTIGGQITGLISGDPVVLQNNGGDNLTLTSDGAFTFSAPIPYTTAYSVTVLTQPSAPSETCTVTNGAGKVPNSNVNNVAVVCALNSFTVGGSVSGLTPGGSIELQNNGVDSQTLMSDGAFTFTAQADGSNYAVTIATQPVSQICSVNDGSGSLAGADVSRVLVSCVNVLPPKIITPVPTNPLWLLGIMAGLLSLVGMSKLRKREACSLGL